MGYVFEGVRLAGQFSLAMTKLQMEFIGALSHMALREGNEQARAWLDWYGDPGMRRLSEPVQIATTNPGVISQFTRTGRLPAQLSADASENSIAMRMLENLRKIRHEDTAFLMPCWAESPRTLTWCTPMLTTQTVRGTTVA